MSVLYAGSYLPDSSKRIDKALEIYERLTTSWPLISHSGPNDQFYFQLIRMLLLATTQKDSYPSIVHRLLDDMEMRDITNKPSLVASTKIILEMRRVGSFADAMDFYRQHRSQLGSRGYLYVLQEYCRLSFSGDLEVAIITEYFSILSHMRSQNIPTDPKVYTIILHQIGIIATKLRFSDLESSSMQERLVDTTRRIHHYLTMDASITPDATLWNQVMNTYQRLELYDDMWKLWRMMRMSGRWDQRTINILIDACGFSGTISVIQSIIKRLLSGGFKLDRHNWNTLVEALCRNQHFDEALEVISVQFAKHNVKPNVETIRIFKKFAAKRQVWDRYGPTLEQAFPDLYAPLQNKKKDD